MEKKYYSRSLKNTPQEQWPLLKDHLMRVAQRASEFAKKLGSESIGYISGLFHDFGKYSDEFQDSMAKSQDEEAHLEDKQSRNKKKKVDHSTAGTVLSLNQYKNGLGDTIARIIASHHSGLPNNEDFRSRVWEEECTKTLRSKAVSLFEASLNQESKELINLKEIVNPPSFFKCLKVSKDRGKRLQELWIRFCFSCLLDADRLDAALDGSPDEHFAMQILKSNYSSLSDLQDKLSKELIEKAQRSHENLQIIKAEGKNAEKAQKVHEARQRILKYCEEAAKEIDKKCFSLTVPTGGGKTLASMKLALDYAVNAEKDRIIVVIPYTSIIEQNAEIYRNIFGETNVLEHHSNLDPAKENELNRLVTDNWDAPIIVTTSVQFFESLFANKTSKCRKLHNLVNSIVIFDEVQTFPPHLLEPILEVLGDLKEYFGMTPVFCTATQPAFDQEDWKEYKDENNPIKKLSFNIHSIIPKETEQKQLFEDLRRVDFNEVSEWSQEKSDEDFAHLIMESKRVLMITDTKKSAQEIFRQVKELSAEEDKNNVFHLSTLMCPVHRKEKLGQIRKILEDKNNTCRVIATQLIEAGVDIDFDRVIRVLGGLDSIAQAAGRCNREGKMIGGFGKVEVYSASSHNLPALLKKTRSITPSVIRSGFNNLPEDFIKYFQSLYSISETGSDINKERSAWNFQNVAEKFRMIESNTFSVVILYSDCELISEFHEYRKQKKRYDEFQLSKSEYSDFFKNLKKLRKLLQRYIVNVYPNNALNLNEEFFERYYTDTEYYDENFGIIVDLSKESGKKVYNLETGLTPEELPGMANHDFLMA